MVTLHTTRDAAGRASRVTPHQVMEAIRLNGWVGHRRSTPRGDVVRAYRVDGGDHIDFAIGPDGRVDGGPVLAWLGW